MNMRERKKVFVKRFWTPPRPRTLNKSERLLMQGVDPTNIQTIVKHVVFLSFITFVIKTNFI